MKSALIPILLVLLLSSIGLNFKYFQKEQSDMTVTKVIDGDTFTIGTGDRVRLLGANAPEEGRCGYEEAKALLTKLVDKKHIRLTEEKRDNYGRRMGLVYVGNTLVNEELLKAGLARPDYSKNTQSERLKAAYNDAVANKRGVHSLCKKNETAKPPDPNCVIKGNIDPATWDHFYHLPSCRHYKQIVLNLDMGEGFFCSEEEATQAGFRLAPDCLR